MGPQKILAEQSNQHAILTTLNAKGLPRKEEKIAVQGLHRIFNRKWN